MRVADRKVCPMPEESQALLREMQQSHAVLPVPPQVGSVMQVRSKRSS